MDIKSYLLNIKDKYLKLKYAVVILAAVLIVYGIYRIIMSPTALTWIEGDSQTYFFSMRSSVKTFDAKTGMPRNSKSEINGKLGFKIFKINDGVIHTGFQFQLDNVTVDNHPVEQIKKLYSYPFYVNFSSAGEPLEIFTSKEVSMDDEQYIRGLVYYLQYVYPSSAVNWEIEENDINGKYLSEYSAGMKDIVKNRHFLRSYKNKDIHIGKTKIKSSSFVYKFDDSWSWVSELKAKERWTNSNSELNISSAIEIELIPDKKGLSDILFLSSQNEDYYKIINSLDISNKKKDSIWEEMRLEKIGETMKSDSYLELISLFNKNRLSDAEFIAKMTDYLKIHKNGAFKLADMILDEKVDDKTVNLVMFSMGNAGTIECQRTLNSLASDSGLAHMNRMRSAVYLGKVKYPDQSTIQTMKSFKTDYSDQSNSMLSSAMVCSLGIMSSVADSEGNSAITSDINNYIREKLNNSSIGNSERCSLISAAANTGDQSFFTEFNRERKNSDSFVRSNAVKALVDMDGEEVDEAVLDSAINDPNPMVRKNAIRVQVQRGYNKEFTDKLISSFDSEKEIEVKIVMVDYLKNVKENDGRIVSFMEKALKKETGRDIRIALIKAINTSKQSN